MAFSSPPVHLNNFVYGYGGKMSRAPLEMNKNSFILSTLSCSGTFQLMMGAALLQEPEWGIGIVYMLIGFGTILGTSRAAAKISALHAAKKTFLESLLVFFAGVLAIWGALCLSIVGAFFTEGLDF